MVRKWNNSTAGKIWDEKQALWLDFYTGRIV